MDQIKKVGVLGVGAWSVALALHLARLGYDVCIWCFEDEAFEEMKEKKTSGPFLPGYTLSDNIRPTQSFEEFFEHSELIFDGVPLVYLREVAETYKQYYVKGKHLFVSMAKGVELDSYLTATKVLQEVLSPDLPELFFSGIGTAQNLADQVFSVGIVAGCDPRLALKLRRMLDTKHFRVDFSDDVVGTQVCTAFKHLLTVIFGVFEGAGAASKVQVTFFITRCLKEMMSVVKSAGGKSETVVGLTGGVDLLIGSSCGGGQKYRLGNCIGKRMPLEEINKNLCFVPEGIGAFMSIVGLGQRLGVEIPVCMAVRDYLLSGYTIDLLDRVGSLASCEYEAREKEFGLFQDQ